MIKDKNLKSALGLSSGICAFVFMLFLLFESEDCSYSVKKGKDGKTVYIHTEKKNTRKIFRILAAMFMIFAGISVIMNLSEESEE